MRDKRAASAIFDATAAIKAVKSREGMIAFAGFSLPVDNGPPIAGLMKVSEKPRAYRGEELVLTFIIDAEADPSVKDLLQERFASVQEPKLSALFGNRLERFTPACLACVDGIEHWLVIEFQIAFRSPMGQKKTILEQDLVPFLEKHLPCRFQGLEWWPQADPALGKHPDTVGARYASLLKKWFGWA
ncbi:MAG: hypothetical protein PVJ53_00350 [Desulfobacterales bacterium]|jgi:hypothetical protein